jgi:hypothetical protein
MTPLASVDASITSPAECKNFASRPPDVPCFPLHRLFDCMRQFSLQRQRERLVVVLAVLCWTRHLAARMLQQISLFHVLVCSLPLPPPRRMKSIQSTSKQFYLSPHNCMRCRTVSWVLPHSFIGVTHTFMCHRAVFMC